MEGFEKLQEFKAVHGNTNVPQKYQADPKLGRWVDAQRKQHRLGILKEERRQILEEIGFEWNYQENKFEQQWNDHYQELVEFHDKHGHVDVPGDYSTLYWWLYLQRTQHANNKLESDRKELLEKIGVDLGFGPRSAKFEG